MNVRLIIAKVMSKLIKYLGTLCILVCIITFPVQAQFSKDFSISITSFIGILNENNFIFNKSNPQHFSKQTGYTISSTYNIKINDELSFNPHIGYKKVFLNIINNLINPINETELINEFKGRIKYELLTIGAKGTLNINKINFIFGFEINKHLDIGSDISNDYGSVYFIIDDNLNSSIFETIRRDRSNLIEDYFASYSAECGYFLTDNLIINLGLSLKPSSKFSIYEYSMKGKTTINGMNSAFDYRTALSSKWTHIFLGITIIL